MPDASLLSLGPITPDMVGSVAAALTTLCFLPQVWKVATERDTRAISAPMYALFTLGVALWLVYGLMLGRPPMIIANAITVVMAAFILFSKLRNDGWR